MDGDNPSGQPREGDALETGAFDHGREFFRGWKLADRFDEIAIGLGIAGDQSSRSAE